MRKAILVIFLVLSTPLLSLADETVEAEYERGPDKLGPCTPKIELPLDQVDEEVMKILNIGEIQLRGESCQYYSKFLDAGVPKNALKQALAYYQKNKKKFKNKNFISIADYSQSSTKKRFYLLDLRSGKVTKEKVSHGSGSLNGVKFADATIKNNKVVRSSSHNGMMKRCRIPKKYAVKGGKHNQWALTRPGFFKVSEFYMSYSHDETNKGRKGWPTMKANGKRRNGLRMDGLTKGVNNKARAQGVVMHEAYYNTGKVMGRSFGCPAFPPKKGRDLMKKMSGGSLYYSYVPLDGCSSDYNKTLNDIKGWEQTCD